MCAFMHPVFCSFGHRSTSMPEPPWFGYCNFLAFIYFGFTNVMLLALIKKVSNTMAYYSAIKRMKFYTCRKIVDPEDITWSEIHQT